ncbi:hypothetical protein Cylst_0712 [Cylindrospermum stagnale PCC 7417]|uniref:Uncharacterized protein n=1 Tax=Cylindrospermum stagnale PCC 7417 TaxID=56107 RepID=K9WRN5_9NOST|nr:hypothetical protein [Cylindrospermum stagnale]AFZ23040.1 hypothetical protein Cylst_0712 [Cylindrospermum stagnale PCC 7417]
MRAAIPLLVSSLVFGSLALNCEAMLGQLSRLLLVSSGSQLLVSAKPKPRPNQPDKPVPHRGSGRRELMESFGNAHFVI